MADNNPKGKRKEESGSNPKTARGKRNTKAKPRIKVTASNTVDFGINPAFANAEKREEPKAQTVPKKPTVPGVRPMRTRPYLAGRVIAKHGLEAGYNAVMVKELNEMFGRDNNIESEGRLAGAWHSVRGYLDQVAEDSVK